METVYNALLSKFGILNRTNVIVALMQVNIVKNVHMTKNKEFVVLNVPNIIPKIVDVH